MKREHRYSLILATLSISVALVGGCTENTHSSDARSSTTSSSAHSSTAQSGTTSSTTPETTSPEAIPGVAMCVASQLEVAYASQGSGQSSVSVVRLTNVGQTPCWLQGFLGVSFPAQGGQHNAVEIFHEANLGPRGFEKGSGSSHPATVELDPREAGSAWVGMSWTNWCGGSQGDLTMKLIFSNGDQLSVDPPELWRNATCVGSTTPYVLEEGPVQSPVN